MKALILIFVVSACGSDNIDSDEQARRAYLGLDGSIGKSITLGFDGFNTASSANIAPQMDVGVSAGTLTVTGQVDQGASANKEMRLYIGMVDYSDGDVVINTDGDTVNITYNTAADQLSQPFLSMKLQNIPTGTLTGTLVGTYTMTGDLEGDADLNLMFTGTLQDSGNGDVIRMPGSTHVTGTAVSGDGTFDVDVTL